ncbi:ATP-binding protein [Streptomyces sp. NPDC051644]|uniref:sensor histidine kinase n=1 Tax=Streptomyces sp. NPDC051644 TaxID=3365666 RepID=UPI0037B439A2
MSDHIIRATVGTAGPGRGRRAHAGHSVRMPPAFTAAAGATTAMGAGWLLDGLGILPAQGSAAAACSAAGGMLWWAGARTRAGRKAVAHAQQVRAERDEALQALRGLLTVVDKGRQSVAWALEQARQGAARTDFDRPVEPSRTGDAGKDATAALAHAFAEACHGVMTGAVRTDHVLNTQAELAEIFSSLAPRLQALVTRGISAISDVEQMVEDPDLLNQLFRVDHLLTRMRREVESLLVLSGNIPSRNTKPVLVVSAIRSAVGEIPDYARVRLAPNPVTAAVPGYVSPNLVHLLAALMENATKFSTEQVEVHTHQTDSGIALEILDRGTGMSQNKRDALNQLLADPESADLQARLREGTIGLLVAALLARHHKISISLRPNVLGGTQAIVLLPQDLITTASELRGPATPEPASGPPPMPQPSGILPGSGTGLPRRIPPARDAAGAQPRPGTPTARAGAQPRPGTPTARPALPRREPGQVGPPVPLRPQPPTGRATSGLMASFRSQTPSTSTASPAQRTAGQPSTPSDTTQE